MKKNKLVILIIIILLIIMLITVIYLVNTIIQKPVEKVMEIDMVEDKKLEVVEDKNDFWIAKKITEQYYDYLMNIDEEKMKIITEMLCPQYVNACTEERTNIKESLKINANIVRIDEINACYMQNEMVAFLVKGNCYGTDIQGIYYNIMILLDKKNSIFEIYPHEYVIGLGYDKFMVGENINIDVNKIINRGNNTYQKVEVTDEMMAQKYYTEYQLCVKKNLNLAYNLLDETYRNARFENFEEYEQYENMKNKKEPQNKEQIKVIKYDNYKEYEYTNEKEYCRVNEYSFTNYKFILDSYTVDSPRVMEDYKKSVIQKKVSSNIEKFIAAINDNNYKYIYNRLNDKFRANKFATIEEFKNYMKRILL